MPLKLCERNRGVGGGGYGELATAAGNAITKHAYVGTRIPPPPTHPPDGGGGGTTKQLQRAKLFMESRARTRTRTITNPYTKRSSLSFVFLLVASTISPHRGGGRKKTRKRGHKGKKRQPSKSRGRPSDAHTKNTHAHATVTSFRQTRALIERGARSRSPSDADKNLGYLFSLIPRSIREFNVMI